jgi:hypothetical protein
MDPKPSPEEVRETLLRHVFDTYITLRIGMIVIAFAFPLLLYAWGLWHGLPLQGSMSAYYWASNEGDPPVRVWFVGGLFAVGSFLMLYKGYTRREDWALNLAALFAIGVALFPMTWCEPHCPDWNPHAWFAIALFVCLAYVTFFRSRDTLHALPNEALEHRYRNIYWGTSAIMLISPVVAIILHNVFQKFDALTYFVELAGIWAFSAFWFAKSWEMRHSRAEKQVLHKASEAAIKQEGSTSEEASAAGEGSNQGEKASSEEGSSRGGGGP